MDEKNPSEPIPQVRPPRRPPWIVPSLYGEQEAIVTSMGSVAASVLAGFSLAAVVQTLTLTSSDLKWRDVTLLLFFLAAVLFIATLQVTFLARMYQTNPSEIKSWWPDADNPARLDFLGREQARLASIFRMWAIRALIIYHSALLVLLAALTTLAVPAESHGHVSVLRWVGVAFGVVVFIVLSILTFAGLFQPRWLGWLLTPKSIRDLGWIEVESDSKP